VAHEVAAVAVVQGPATTSRDQMDEAGIPYVLQSERMGHEVPGIRGVYSHVSPAMRAELMANLEERWQTALAERGRIAPGSSVHLLDELLAARK
jgi:hypothetical protein